MCTDGNGRRNGREWTGHRWQDDGRPDHVEEEDGKGVDFVLYELKMKLNQGARQFNIYYVTMMKSFQEKYDGSVSTS